MSVLFPAQTLQRRNHAPVRRKLLAVDTFTQGSPAISLGTHTPNTIVNQGIGAAWQQITDNVPLPSEAYLGGSGSNSANQLYNSMLVNGSTNGSARAYYYLNIDTASPSYRVHLTQSHQSIAQAGGYICKAALYAQPDANTAYLGTVYFDNRDAATSGITGTPGWVVSLEKQIDGVNTRLDRVCIQSMAAPTWPQTTDLYFEVLADGTKIVSVRLPGEAKATRRIASTDTSIVDRGYPGFFMDRCSSTQGGHITRFEVDARPSAPTRAIVTDPTESPSLLWKPDYANNIGTNVLATANHNLWYSAQKPKVRGVTVEDRMKIVDSNSLPGGGTYKPTAAMRVEIRDFWSTGAFTGSGGNQMITSTATATSTGTTLTFSSADAAFLFNKDMVHNERTGEWVRVNGAISAGSVPVLRAQTSTGAGVNVGDIWRVACGDVNDSGSSTNAYATSRAEVLARTSAEYNGNGTPSSWPDPVGSIRYYGCSYYIDPGTWPGNTGYDGTNPWLTLTQWKNSGTGSPPRALGIDVKTGNWILDGTSGRPRIILKPVTAGVWQRFIFGFRWECEAYGWLEVYDGDGTVLVAQRAEATMFKDSSGQPVPNYLKEGVYRAKDGWRVPMIFFYSPMKIGTDYASVANV